MLSSGDWMTIKQWGRFFGICPIILQLCKSIVLGGQKLCFYNPSDYQ